MKNRVSIMENNVSYCTFIIIVGTVWQTERIIIHHIFIFILKGNTNAIIIIGVCNRDNCDEWLSKQLRKISFHLGDITDLICIHSQGSNLIKSKYNIIDPHVLRFFDVFYPYFISMHIFYNGNGLCKVWI